MENNSNEEISFKEKRIRDITLIYYSIPEIKNAIFEFSKNRECVPRYFEGFGKRPDTFQYDSEILEQVRKGATSFHCSEELWENPLDISTSLKEKQLNELRTGWDLLLDIDSPYLEYSKIYADLVIQTLEFHGIKNIGVKFSGNKGFHLIVPWKAFPKEIYGQKTKDMFPEWPKIICQYLASLVKPKLPEKLFETESLKDIAQKTGKTEKELTITECKKCNRPAEKKFLITWICPYCKNEIVNQEGTFNNRKKPKCPECRKDLIEKLRNEIYYCVFCNINSNKNPENFEKTRDKTETLIDADLILVASRHLFRMPYSLHEKTALSSIVIDKDKIKDFQITDAKPFKVKVKNFYPESEEGEAKELLLQALDWKEQKDKSKKPLKYSGTQQDLNQQDNESPKQKSDYKEIKILNPTNDIYPPCIKLLLNGVKDDGRKRALFVLINFFKSIGTDENFLNEIIEKWNEKNYTPLKQGYIQSQLNWYKKTGTRMPPNCDKTNYNDLNVCKPDELCRKIKNPVNYAVRKYLGKR
ncbi:MAG: hypothetical protein AABW67_03075 [Nanoarchaeota archaeon]